jgi:tetratricopeptide (TPR) repeat protein
VRKPVTVLLVTVMIAAGAAIVRLGATLDQRRYADDIIEELTYFPSGRFMTLADLGFGTLIADAMWLRGIQYYGTHRKSDRAYPLAEHVFATLTDLDPQFINAYRFGALVLAEDVGATGAAIDLLRKGIRNNPDRWEIPFDLGFIHFVQRNDWARAAHYFRFASRLENSPEITRRFTAFAYKKAGRTDLSRALWEELYASTDNAVMKETAEAAIKNICIDETTQALSGAVAKFHEATGRVPTGLSDVVKAGLAKEVPAEPFGGFYFIDPATGRVLSTSRVTVLAAKAVAVLQKAVERHNGRTGSLPQSLADLVSEGLVEQLPEVEGARLAYDPASGTVTCDLVWKGVGR